MYRPKTGDRSTFKLVRDLACCQLLNTPVGLSTSHFHGIEDEITKFPNYQRQMVDKPVIDEITNVTSLSKVVGKNLSLKRKSLAECFDDI